MGLADGGVGVATLAGSGLVACAGFGAVCTGFGAGIGAAGAATGAVFAGAGATGAGLTSWAKSSLADRRMGNRK